MSNSETTQITSKVKLNAPGNRKQQDYERHLYINNIVYSVNTFARPFGSISNEALMRNFVYLPMGKAAGNYYMWVEALKGISHIAGFVYGYYRLGKDRDASKITDRWLTVSVMCFSIMLSISTGLVSKTYLKYTMLLLALLYKFFQGDRDACRPYYWKCIVANVVKNDSVMSDQCKNQMRQRKIMTTIAELVGGAMMYLLLRHSNVSVAISLGIACNLIAYATLKWSELCPVDDPKMTEKLAEEFVSEGMFSIFGKGGEKWKWIDRSKDSKGNVMVQTFKNIFSIDKLIQNGQLSKDVAFIYLLIIIRLFTGIGKSYFLYQASWYPQYNTSLETISRGMTSWGLMLWDLYQSFYRKSYGVQRISSLGGIILGLCNFQLANLSSWMTTGTSNGLWSLFFGYPLCNFANSLLIQSLTHLFEIWGRGDESSNPLFLSFRNNIVSIASMNLGKSVVGILLRYGVYTPVQLLMCFKAYMIAKALIKVADEAESV